MTKTILRHLSHIMAALVAVVMFGVAQSAWAERYDIDLRQFHEENFEQDGLVVQTVGCEYTPQGVRANAGAMIFHVEAPDATSETCYRMELTFAKGTSEEQIREALSVYIDALERGVVTGNHAALTFGSGEWIDVLDPYGDLVLEKLTVYTGRSDAVPAESDFNDSPAATVRTLNAVFGGSGFFSQPYELGSFVESNGVGLEFSYLPGDNKAETISGKIRLEKGDAIRLWAPVGYAVKGVKFEAYSLLGKSTPSFYNELAPVTGNLDVTWTHPDGVASTDQYAEFAVTDGGTIYRVVMDVVPLSNQPDRRFSVVDDMVTPARGKWIARGMVDETDIVISVPQDYPVTSVADGVMVAMTLTANGNKQTKFVNLPGSYSGQEVRFSMVLPRDYNQPSFGMKIDFPEGSIMSGGNASRPFTLSYNVTDNLTGMRIAGTRPPFNGDDVLTFLSDYEFYNERISLGWGCGLDWGPTYADVMKDVSVYYEGSKAQNVQISMDDNTRLTIGCEYNPMGHYKVVLPFGLVQNAKDGTLSAAEELTGWFARYRIEPNELSFSPGQAYPVTSLKTITLRPTTPNLVLWEVEKKFDLLMREPGKNIYSPVSVKAHRDDQKIIIELPAELTNQNANNTRYDFKIPAGMIWTLNGAANDVLEFSYDINSNLVQRTHDSAVPTDTHPLSTNGEEGRPGSFFQVNYNASISEDQYWVLNDQAGHEGVSLVYNDPYGNSFNLLFGVEAICVNGVTQYQVFYYNDEYTYINHPAEGTYTLHMPGGLIHFADGSVNAEEDVVWTYGNFFYNYEAKILNMPPYESLASPMLYIDGFDLMPQAEGTVNASPMVAVVMEKPYVTVKTPSGETKNVDVKVTINGSGTAHFELAEPLTEKGRYYLTLPAGIVRNQNQMTNPQYDFSYLIKPATSFEIQAERRPKDLAWKAVDDFDLILTNPDYTLTRTSRDDGEVYLGFSWYDEDGIGHGSGSLAYMTISKDEETGRDKIHFDLDGITTWRSRTTFSITVPEGMIYALNSLKQELPNKAYTFQVIVDRDARYDYDVHVKGGTDAFDLTLGGKKYEFLQHDDLYWGTLKALEEKLTEEAILNGFHSNNMPLPGKVTIVHPGELATTGMGCITLDFRQYFDVASLSVPEGEYPLYSPALDGFKNFNVVLGEDAQGTWSLQGQGDASFYLSAPNGDHLTFKYFRATEKSNVINFCIEEPIDQLGTYTLHLDEEFFPSWTGKVNKEWNFQWTVTKPESFRILGYYPDGDIDYNPQKVVRNITYIALTVQGTKGVIYHGSGDMYTPFKVTTPNGQTVDLNFGLYRGNAPTINGLDYMIIMPQEGQDSFFSDNGDGVYTVTVPAGFMKRQVLNANGYTVGYVPNEEYTFRMKVDNNVYTRLLVTVTDSETGAELSSKYVDENFGIENNGVVYHNGDAMKLVSGEDDKVVMSAVGLNSYNHLTLKDYTSKFYKDPKGVCTMAMTVELTYTRPTFEVHDVKVNGQGGLRSMTVVFKDITTKCKADEYLNDEALISSIKLYKYEKSGWNISSASKLDVDFTKAKMSSEVIEENMGSYINSYTAITFDFEDEAGNSILPLDLTATTESGNMAYPYYELDVRFDNAFDLPCKTTKANALNATSYLVNNPESYRVKFYVTAPEIVSEDDAAAGAGSARRAPRAKRSVAEQAAILADIVTEKQRSGSSTNDLNADGQYSAGDVTTFIDLHSKVRHDAPEDANTEDIPVSQGEN